MCKRDCKKRTRNFLPRFLAADAEIWEEGMQDVFMDAPSL